MSERGEKQPEQEGQAVERKEYTTADVIVFLQEELHEKEGEWAQDFETPPPTRPEDWQNALSQIEIAITTLEQGDPTVARILLEADIHDAQRALDGRSLDMFREGYERDNARQLRQAHLEEIEALRRVLG